MALALDGSVHSNAVSATHNLSLTTSNADDVIVAMVACNLAAGVSSISSANTTGWTQRAVGGSGSSRIEIWYGVASSALSSETITVTIGASAYTTIDIFGISGADTTQIYDANGALPDVGTTTTRSISTNTADTFCIGAYRFGSTAAPTEGAGWTKISGAHYVLTEYKIVSSTQSGLSVAIGTGAGNQNGGVADAIVIASAGGTAYTITPSGGITIGGSSGITRDRVIAVSGGITVGGAAPDYETHNSNLTISPSGGVVMGGTAAITFGNTTEYTITPSGGVVISGVVPISRDRTIGISGGITLGGTAPLETHNVENIITPSGGIVLDGTTALIFTSGDFVSIKGGMLMMQMAHRRRRPRNKIGKYE